MSNEYVIAHHRRMLIRIVEPAQFAGRTVAERRPLSFAGDVVVAEEKLHPISIATCVALCAFMFAALGCCIAYGLHNILTLWLT